MDVTYAEFTRGPSPKLWSGIVSPSRGGFEGLSSGSPTFGFFDDFLHNTSQYDDYYHNTAGTGTLGRIVTDWDPGSPTTTGIGLLQMFGTADDDEAVIAYGNAADAPFKLDYSELCFECRLKCETIDADEYGFFVGLAERGSEAEAQIIGTGNAVTNTYDLCGFQKLYAETSAIDGMYQVGSVTKVDGAVKTKLDTIGTLVAGTYIKLGLKYTHSPHKLEWFVDGRQVALLSHSELEAANFPEDNFLTPTIVLATGGTSDSTTVVDWWGCVQKG